KFLAEELVSFIRVLHESTDFMVGELHSSILSAETDLENWASCLLEFQGLFGCHLVQLYIHNLSKDVYEEFENIRIALTAVQEDDLNARITSPSTSNVMNSILFEVSDLNMTGRVQLLQRVAGGGYSDVWKGTLNDNYRRTEVSRCQLSHD
ncbi:hypothetical protein FRC03_002936, partial [Tulasnella sp. 419]